LKESAAEETWRSYVFLFSIDYLDGGKPLEWVNLVEVGDFFLRKAEQILCNGPKIACIDLQNVIVLKKRVDLGRIIEHISDSRVADLDLYVNGMKLEQTIDLPSKYQILLSRISLIHCWQVAVEKRLQGLLLCSCLTCQESC
jgi:hypothetical protein